MGRYVASGGTVALTWNATRIERVAMTGLVEQHSQLAHMVDRVIKRRDILVAVKA
jgi:hypothetical protein